MNHQPDIHKIYLYAKDPYEAKYQLLINKREGPENQKILKNTTQETQNIVFYDMIA